jgi:hypothetical protein
MTKFLSTISEARKYNYTHIDNADEWAGVCGGRIR